MKKFLKIFSVVLAVLMAVSILPSCGDETVATTSFEVPADRYFVDDVDSTEGFYQYRLLDDNTVIIMEYTGQESEVVIPEKLGGYPVSTIGGAAFYANEFVKKIVISNGVDTIGSNAFNGCANLEDVFIPNTVWNINADAFTDTPWLKKFEKEEFVIVGDSILLKYNGDSVRVVIPDTVKHISAAFIGNEKIRDVVVPDSVYTVGHAAFAASTVSRVHLGNNVVLIGDSAFNACLELYYINFPDSLKKIDSYAFGSCTGLNYIKFGKGLEYIGECAFSRATQLHYIYLPKSIVPKEQNKYDEEAGKTIADRAFEDCAISYIFFEGSQAEFERISLTGTNSYLADAERIYDYNY